LVFITSPIKTYTSEEYIRLETIVSVHYNTDLEFAKKIIVDAINSLKFIVNKEHTDVITHKFADSGIDLKVWFYIDPNGEKSLAHSLSVVNNTIYEAFKANDIVIPYPHTVVTVDKNDQNLLKTLLFLKSK
jgi:small-conductance mechanosensitive channel